MDILDVICLAISFLFVVGMCFLPSSACDWLAQKASFGSFGIRELPRRNDKTDTLGNCILFLLFVFSCTYWLIPDMTIVYIVYTILYLLSCIFLLGQTCRVSKDYSDGHHLALFLLIGLMMFVAYVSAIGLLNGQQIITDVVPFRKQVQTDQLLDVFYYLKNHEIFSVILQGILFFASFYLVWAQFKYMRLEDSYKANHIVLFAFKIIFVCIIMLGLSYGGYYMIDFAYYVGR